MPFGERVPESNPEPLLLPVALGVSRAPSRRYWARRVWVFLCKVRELKSVVKDEKRLHDPTILKRWPS